MTKISILTFHFSNNIGAMLQAYGLTKAIKAMGHEVQIIDYRPLSIRKIYKSPLPRHPVKFLRELMFRSRIRGFRKKFLPLSRIYLDIEELKQYPPRADCIVCGSDQVWNIKSVVRGFDPVFFLDFLDEHGPKRVSYAASFGNGTDLGDYKTLICDLLSQFDHISVRDRVSQSLVRDLTGKEAYRVLDPSFLTDFESITPPPIIKDPYILAYCFRKSELAERTLREIQLKYKIPVISIKTAFEKSKVVKPSPRQWLSLMKNADYICTDSFHGTCFSLINRKQFITLPFPGGNSRLVDILQTTELSDRLVTDNDSLKQCLHEIIDYDKTSAVIAKSCDSSLSFLSNALES